MSVEIFSANRIYRFIRRDRPQWDDVGTPVVVTLTLLCVVPAWFYGEAAKELSPQFFEWSIHATLSSLLDWRFTVAALLFGCIASLGAAYAAATGFLASILGKRMISLDNEKRGAHDKADD